tara:strand:- start:1636 stop:2160 length:525 start_codon:yes stop_codon:yes gene_type:complete
MENYYRVLELIEENKDNIPQGHYIEIMEKFKKTKDHIDKMADKLDDEKKEVSKKAQFYNKKIKEMDKDKRILLLKKHNETLNLKCKAYHRALLRIEDFGINMIVLDDFKLCPMTNKVLYNLRIRFQDETECIDTNMIRCCVCNIIMFDEIDCMSNPHYKRKEFFYCKNCWDIMD